MSGGLKVSEREFLNWILDVAARFSWRAYHVPTPMRPIGGGRFVPESRAAGLPDLILLHDKPPRLILAEVKDADGKLSPEQVEFLHLAAGVAGALRNGDDRGPFSVHVWRPGAEAIIEAILRGKPNAA